MKNQILFYLFFILIIFIIFFKKGSSQYLEHYCENGTQTREVHCVDQDGKRVPDKYCKDLKKESLTKSCEKCNLTTTTKAHVRCEGKWELPKCPTKCGYKGGTVYADWKVTKDGSNCPEKNLGPKEIKYGRTSKECRERSPANSVTTLFNLKPGGTMDMKSVKQEYNLFPDKQFFINQGTISGEICAVGDDYISVQQLAGSFSPNTDLTWGDLQTPSLQGPLGQASIISGGCPADPNCDKMVKERCGCTETTTTTTTPPPMDLPIVTLTNLCWGRCRPGKGTMNLDALVPDFNAGKPIYVSQGSSVSGRVCSLNKDPKSGVYQSVTVISEGAGFSSTPTAWGTRPPAYSHNPLGTPSQALTGCTGPSISLCCKKCGISC